MSDYEHWIKVAGWWLNNQTGETRSVDTFSPSGWFRQGKWWVNYDGTTRPISMGDPRGTNDDEPHPELDPPTTFVWKGKDLTIPTMEMVKRSEIPHQDLALWLVERLWALRGNPSASPCGYSEAARAAGVLSVMAVFGPLNQVQRFCNRNNWFDLSALIVNGKTHAPSSGSYGGNDYGNEDEWKQYMGATVNKTHEVLE